MIRPDRGRSRHDRVEILLSTCDGARFLPELLQSLFGQDYPRLAIRVRDDGSQDGTRHQLDRLPALTDSPVDVSVGPRLGIIPSYFRLLREASPDAGYYALCDQDDVWQPDKVSRAVALLSRGDPGQPALYCGRQWLVNQGLGYLGRSPVPRRPPAFRNALVNNIATGCTVVINRPARALLLEGPTPEDAVMHDWWMYLVMVALGRVIYDREPKVLYRQHPGNAIGHRRGLLSVWLHRYRKYGLRSRSFSILRQARAFAACYRHRLTPADRRILDGFLAKNSSFPARARYALLGEVQRQTLLDGLVMRLSILLNRL